MKRGYLHLSFALSVCSLIATLLINLRIAERYKIADGKTRALYGINELLQFGYQYYIAFLGFGAVIVALIQVRKDTRKSLWACLLGLISIVLVFARIWRLFV